MFDNKKPNDAQSQEYTDALIGNSVPLIYAEAINSRHERKEARILICSAVVILLTVITCILVVYFNNLSWQKFFENYDFESYELSADGNSNANYIGGNGDITNGGEDKSETETDENNDSKGEVREKEEKAE